MPKPLILAYHSLAASGRQVVPLSEVAQSPGSVALTFDDAHRNFSTHALPILQ